MPDDSVYPWSLANTSYTMVDGMPVFLQIRASTDRLYDCVHFGMGGTAMTSFHISVYKITAANTLTLLRSLGNVKSSLVTSILGASESAVGTASPTSPGNAGSYEVGNRIKFNAAGSLTGLRFWRDSGQTSTTRVLHVWSTGGTLLATSNASSETGMYGTGQWVSVTLATPISVAVNDQLVVSRPDAQFYSASATPPTYASDFTFVQGQYTATLNAYPSATNTYDYAVDVVFRPNVTNFEQSLFLIDPIDAAAGEDLYVGFLAVGGTMPVWFASNLIAPNTTNTMGSTPTLNQITAVASAGGHTDLTASTKTLSTVLSANVAARPWGALGNFGVVPRMPAFAVDTFNRINCPALLQPWGGHPSLPKFAVYNSTASPVVDATYGTYSYWIPTMRSNDHYAQVKLGADMASDAPVQKDFYLGVRSSRGVTGPAVKLHIKPDGTFRIVNVTSTYNNGGLTQRATAPAPLTFKLGDVVKIVAANTIYTAFYNDALVCSWVDSGVLHPVSADQRWVDMTMPITATANLQIADNFEAGDFGGGVQLVSPPLIDSSNVFYGSAIQNNVTVQPAPAILTLSESAPIIQYGAGMVPGVAQLTLVQQPANVSVPTVTSTEINTSRSNYAIPVGAVGVWITLIGAGGGGGFGYPTNTNGKYGLGGAGGGGGARISRTFIPRSAIGATYTVTRAASGGVGADGGAGGNGSATVFSSGSVTATAGGGTGAIETPSWSGSWPTPLQTPGGTPSYSGFMPSSTETGGDGWSNGASGNPPSTTKSGAGGGSGTYVYVSGGAPAYYNGNPGGSAGSASGGTQGANSNGGNGGAGNGTGYGGGGGGGGDGGSHYIGGNGGIYGGGGGGGSGWFSAGGVGGTGGSGGSGYSKLEWLT